MLVCGEDLGMVPDCVPWVMNQLQILSLEIQRMPKSPAHEFGQVHEYPFQSVCTIGTHDMSTFRGWWEEDKELTERFYHRNWDIGAMFLNTHQSGCARKLYASIWRVRLCSVY